MSEENKAIVRRMFEAWNSGNTDDLDELIADNHVNHDPNNPEDFVGVEGYSQLISLYRSGFPDLYFEIHGMVAQDDVVCTRWTGHSTHTGELLGLAPTGAKSARTGMSWIRIEGGKAVETWIERDGLGLMRDLGLVPSPE